MSRTALVVSFDRLHLGYAGPYGNEWIETPTLDRLAADAVVFDECLGEARSPDDPAHAFWQQGTWLAAAKSRGVRSIAVCDADLPAAVGSAFESVTLTSGNDGPDYSESEGTFARLMGEAVRVVGELAVSDRPAVLWVRSRGVSRPWLPPRELAELYLDEFGLSAPADGPDAPEAEVLHLAGRESDLPYIKAMYAASVSYLDRWLATLFSALARLREPPLIVLTAAAGEELGEHGEPGATFDDPYSPTIHVPLIVRWPGCDDGSRRRALVASADVPPTVCEWLGVEFPVDAGDSSARCCLPGSLGPLLRCEAENLRDELLVLASDHVGLRTAEHYYLRSRNPSAGEGLDAAELFEKPFDRWDLANRASMFPGIVEAMDARLQALVSQP